MSGIPHEPLREHVMIVEQPRPSAAALRHLRMKQSMTEVRGLENRRRTDELVDNVEQISARLDALERPISETTQETRDRVDASVIVSSDGRSVDPGTANWIVDEWRQHGWSDT